MGKPLLDVRIQVTIRWDGQTTLRSLVFKWLWGGMGKPLLEVSYSSDYVMGILGGDGQTTLRSLVFKWLWGGMGKPLLEVSYSSDYEVGWANHS